MMETGKSPAVQAKKSSTTPKAIIYKKFGDKACYKVEEVEDFTQNGCPGLAIQKKGPCLFRCTLQLPDIVVVSDTFRKKKDAEQAAAEKAVEKLGIHQKEYNPTVQEAWDDLAGRLSYLFAAEFLSSGNPLSGHFRAALRREGELNGSVPASAIAAYDAKITTICKYIKSEAESNSLVVLSLVLKAASQLPDLVLASQEKVSLVRRNPHPPEIIQFIGKEESGISESIQIEVVSIPSSVEKAVKPLMLKVNKAGYYFDVLARELDAIEASEIMVSRTIGKASSDMRIYYRVSRHHLLEHLSESQVNGVFNPGESFNARASYLSGQEVYGDAILASIGYTWKSPDLGFEDVSLQTYYRTLLSKMPSGVYKLSREAILASELPIAFTTRSNWRGSFPRDILCTFCRLHRLSEPVFSTLSDSLESSADSTGSRKKLKVMDSDKEGKDVVSAGFGAFKCEVKMYTKSQDLLLHCSPQQSYKKQIDAIQHTALKVLTWLNKFFEKPDMSLEKLHVFAEKLEIHFSSDNFFKEFELCQSVHTFGSSRIQAASSITDSVENKAPFVDIRGQSSGITPSSGCLVCISYSVSLVTEGNHMKEHLESYEAFEFEIGTEAVMPHLELVVTQMSVGQSAFFHMELPTQEFILAAAGSSAATLSLLSLKNCCLEYAMTLLHVTEPLEERMEQALFSPPLSKQRVEFAVQYIKESSAASLVDFGCGSGSLLDSLLEYPTSLEKIVGVDISQRSLARAAKILHLKLNRNLDAKVPSSKIKSALLYDGSITVFDSRLYGFDIGTCLEVIEHMEEEEAHLFGAVVLSSFCPRILIVSTPNYEYNVILQKSTPQSHEEELDEKNNAQGCKFRNHDHKFEWTRAQFNHWASELASRHNYNVEFSGVGGVQGVEPGFASQIAIFRRRNDGLKKVDSSHHYAAIWEWGEKKSCV